MKNRFVSGTLFSKRPRALVPKESAVTAAVAEYFNNRRFFNLRLNSGKIITKQGHAIELCETGTPDRFLILKVKGLPFGIPVFVEVKSPGKKPTPEQLKKHEEIRLGGGAVIVAESVTDLISGLKQIEREALSLTELD